MNIGEGISFGNGINFIIETAANPTAGIRYTTPGTYSFTVPEGITSVSALCVGGGGGAAGSGAARAGAAGGGGGLVYGSFAVTPGETLNIFVGASGTGGANNITNGTAGGNSEIQRTGTALLFAGGGGRGLASGASGIDQPNTGGLGGTSSGTQRSGGDRWFGRKCVF